MYAMEVTMLFLICVSETTMIKLEHNDVLRAILSSLQRWAALTSLSLWSAWWNEKWLGNLSTNLDPGVNLLSRESKEEKIPLS